MHNSAHIVDLLVERHVFEGRSSKIAIIDDERRWSYGELRAAVSNVAAWLLSRGISAGDGVAILVEDGLESVVAWLGAMRAGGVAMLMNPSLPTEQYGPLFDKAGPRFALVDAEAEKRLALRTECTARIERGRRLIVREGMLWGARVEGPAAIPARPVRDRDDPAFALFTSGTTGSASCVVHRHRDIAETNRGYGSEIVSIRQDDITFSASPLFFAYGLNSVHMALYHGGTAVLPPKNKRPGDILSLIERHRPTIFFAVPTVYRMILGHGDSKPLDSLRLCVSAGEKLSVKIFEEWRSRYGFEILDGIGTTEVLSTFITNRPGDIRPGSTGKLVRGFDVRLMTSNLEEASAGENGVLWVRGATISDEYLSDPVKSEERFRDGWFVTNDVFRRDEDGCYYYVGRTDELAKVGGKWVASSDLEGVLVNHPAIHECAVVNCMDEWGLARPHAFVVLRGNADIALDWQKELKNFCRRRVSGASYPHFVSVVNALPRTPTGKVQRFKLRDALGSRARAPSREHGT